MTGRARALASLAIAVVSLALPATAGAVTGWLPAQSHGAGLDPVLAGNAAGTFAIAWTDSADGTVKARVRSPSGAFGPVEPVPATPAPLGQNLKLGLAVDAGGRVHLAIALAGGRPLEYRQRPADATWLATAENVGLVNASDVSLAAAPDGTAVIAYTGIDDKVYVCARPLGGPCGGSTNLTPTAIASSGPEAAMDADGDAVVAFRMDDVPTAARVPRAGGIATEPLDGDAGSLDLGVAVADSGDAVFAWRDGVLETNSWPTTAAPAPLSQAFAAGTATWPDVAIDASGIARFAWSEIPAGSADDAIHSRLLPLGGAFTQPSVLVASDDPLLAPRLASSAAGGGLVAWRRTGSMQAIEARALPSGGAAGAVQRLSPSGAASVSDHQAVVDSTGSGLVLWRRDQVIETAAFDAVAPSLAQPAVPVRAERGVPIQLAVTATDNWGSVAPQWRFGDGTGAAGAAVSHAWQSPGAYDVRVSVADAGGNSASAVAARPVTVTDSRSPRFLSARMLRRRFRVGRPRPRPSAVKRGSAFVFALSEPASVRISLRRRKGRRFVRVGALRRSAHEGRTVVPFDGRVRRKALRRGVYRASLVATDPYANPSRPRRLSFRIAR